ncbi:MAG: hypothetical protein QMC19_00675 [Flavobacteriaceae bacterium]|jgi:hypothetical protein|tara:strand:- start:263 stop:547 length:285 start_codon:yes stop_codon:yes gene_type:complete
MKKRPIIILSLITVLLMIPLIAMQFTNQVNWSVGDFIVMAMLLYGTGVLCEFAIRRITTISYRYLTIVLILLCCLVIWAELSVGLFSTLFELAK